MSMRASSRKRAGVDWGLRLTTAGVRRSSCRPSPPRIRVLPVSIMTTLESRKPMLLIVLSVVDAFDGFAWG
jgi:hypothetical protein